MRSPPARLGAAPHIRGITHQRAAGRLPRAQNAANCRLVIPSAADRGVAAAPRRSRGTRRRRRDLDSPCKARATSCKNASRSSTRSGRAARKMASSCSSVSRIGAMGSGHTAESDLPQRIANANSSGGSKSEPPEDKCVRHHARCALAWPCCRCLTRACAWTSQNLPTTRRVSRYPWGRCWRLQLSPPGR
jgi:hypothetical protein